LQSAETIAQPVGSLGVALAHAARLLLTHPALAEDQAREILTSVPGHPPALYLLGEARRRLGDPESARAILAPLAASQPKAAQVHFALGLTLAAWGMIRRRSRRCGGPWR